MQVQVGLDCDLRHDPTGGRLRPGAAAGQGPALGLGPIGWGHMPARLDPQHASVIGRQQQPQWYLSRRAAPFGGQMQSPNRG